MSEIVILAVCFQLLKVMRKVMGSSPIQAWIFSDCFFNCLS